MDGLAERGTSFDRLDVVLPPSFRFDRQRTIFEEEQAAEDVGDTEDGQELKWARRLSSISNAIFLRRFLEVNND